MNVLSLQKQSESALSLHWVSVSHVCKQLGRTLGALAGAGAEGGDADAAGELGTGADPAGTDGCTGELGLDAAGELGAGADPAGTDDCTGELGLDAATPGDDGEGVVGGATHLVQMVDVEVLMTVETVTVGLPLTVMGQVVTVVYALQRC